MDPPIENPVEIIKKKRKNVEHNGMELIVGYILSNPSASFDTFKTEVLDNHCIYPKINFNTDNDSSKYRQDLLMRDPNFIRDYYTKFSELYKELGEPDPPIEVFISGKSNKHDRIKTLNKDIDKKSAKADVYALYDNNRITGFSVKQSPKATKSNYSVYKFLSKEECNHLTALKKEVFQSNQIDETTPRDIINRLFYCSNPNPNPFMTSLKNYIAAHSLVIKESLANALYCKNIPYDIYEYDGQTLVKLRKTADTVSFEEYAPYYYTKQNVMRECAKLFYRLSVGGTHYRVEVKWKGNNRPKNIKSAPQFMTYNDNETTSNESL
jgi:hypothetical protein